MTSASVIFYAADNEDHTMTCSSYDNRAFSCTSQPSIYSYIQWRQTKISRLLVLLLERTRLLKSFTMDLSSFPLVHPKTHPISIRYDADRKHDAALDPFCIYWVSVQREVLTLYLGSKDCSIHSIEVRSYKRLLSLFYRESQNVDPVRLQLVTQLPL